MANIHPTAIVHPDAVIAEGVSVGPWSIVEANVEIGRDSRIASHCVIKGHTKLGERNEVYQFCSIGEDCQDKKYAGELTYLHIGDDNIFRESCTIHRGTVQDNGITKIGNRNLFMVNVHVAHDCVVGDDVIMANNSAAAGHVHIANRAILGGFTAVHQFCRVGTSAMCGAGTVVLKDIPAYVMTNGNPAEPHGINAEGLRRLGYDASTISQLKLAYKIVYRQKLTSVQAQQRLEEMLQATPEVGPLLDSLRSASRGIIR
ncbi:MAG: acyl-ACP--UDP-N-acetylglucosamine O-acyltransferase [Pseudomonadales bacterium]